ncbi:hypothetical protein JXL19_00135, partial [bacterium]|nr:hypothetical protein [bacterium]
FATPYGMPYSGIPTGPYNMPYGADPLAAAFGMPFSGIPAGPYAMPFSPVYDPRQAMSGFNPYMYNPFMQPYQPYPFNWNPIWNPIPSGGSSSNNYSDDNNTDTDTNTTVEQFPNLKGNWGGNWWLLQDTNATALGWMTFNIIDHDPNNTTNGGKLKGILNITNWPPIDDYNLDEDGRLVGSINSKSKTLVARFADSWISEYEIDPNFNYSVIWQFDNFVITNSTFAATFYWTDPWGVQSYHYKFSLGRVTQ